MKQQSLSTNSIAQNAQESNTSIQWKDLKIGLINISNEDNIYEMEKNTPEEEEDK